MIIGFGVDIVDITRIEKSLAEFGETFEKKIFTAGEQAKAQSRANAGGSAVAATYAKRFAAKEACMKALGARGNNINWLDMEITTDENGAPSLQLSGAALARFEQLTPAGHSAKIWLSLSDEHPIAQAQVIIEAIAPQATA